MALWVKSTLFSKTRQDNIHIAQVVVVRHQQHRPWLYEIKSTLFSKTRQYTHCAGSSGWTPATQAMALWIKSTLFSKTRQDNIHIAQVVAVGHQQHRPWLWGSNQHYLVRQDNIHIAQVVVVRHQQHRPWLCGSNQHYLVRQDKTIYTLRR